LNWHKKSLLINKRLAKSACTPYLSATLTDLAPSHFWGLLQLHRADPSAAPDKIMNELLIQLLENNKPTEYS
jgi:hypothetical protein